MRWQGRSPHGSIYSHMKFLLRRVAPIFFAALVFLLLAPTGCRPASPTENPTPTPTPSAPAAAPTTAAVAPETPNQPAEALDATAQVPAETKAETAKEPDPELPDPVAVVEGEKISRADLQEAFKNALAASGINPDDIEPAQKMSGYREILDELIVDKLVSRKASSVEIKDADLAAEVTRVKGQFPSEEAFKAEMQKAGETQSSFQETVKRMMQQQKWMQEQIGDKATVGDADAKK
ncbi:MAG: SurA N-terminal domain, partial [Verrucomicrobiota bacterium]